MRLTSLITMFALCICTGASVNAQNYKPILSPTSNGTIFRSTTPTLSWSIAANPNFSHEAFILQISTSSTSWLITSATTWEAPGDTTLYDSIYNSAGKVTSPDTESTYGFNYDNCEAKAGPASLYLVKW